MCIRDSSKWMRYLYRLMDETDPHVLKMTALNLGFEAAYFGTKTIRENRRRYQCNIPWLILMDPTSACKDVYKRQPVSSDRPVTR